MFIVQIRVAERESVGKPASSWGLGPPVGRATRPVPSARSRCHNEGCEVGVEVRREAPLKLEVRRGRERGWRRGRDGGRGGDGLGEGFEERVLGRGSVAVAGGEQEARGERETGQGHAHTGRPCHPARIWDEAR